MAADLTADEYALYDRQVRLWGASAQQSIGQAHVLIISLRALGTEIAKNLTLAGIGSLTIIDDDPVTEEDLGAGYFFRSEDIGNPRGASAISRIQELNPRVKIQTGTRITDFAGIDPSTFEQYSLVVACDLDFASFTLVNAAARLAGRPFYAAGIHGEFGFIFADLIDHKFTMERDASNKPAAIGVQETTTRTVVDVQIRREAGQAPKEVITKREVFCPLILANSSPLDITITSKPRRLRNVPALLPAIRALFDFQRQNNGRTPQATNSFDIASFTAFAKMHTQQLSLPPDTLTADFLRAFIPALGAEIPPTASFIGSRLSEDIINAVTHREQPIQNFALFDGEIGPIYSLFSPPPELVVPAPLPPETNGVSSISQPEGSTHVRGQAASEEQVSTEAQPTSEIHSAVEGQTTAEEAPRIEEQATTDGETNQIEPVPESIA